MQKFLVTAAVAAAFAVTAAPAAADVQLSIQNGRVTILAKDATVRQILTEWARVGQTKIVNVERIPGAPITLELRNIPEQQALKMLLRTVSGYVTAPRTTMVTADTSVFDRIIVMPTLAAAAPPPSNSPPPPTFSAFQPPQQNQNPEDREEGPTAQGPQAPANRGAVFTFPQPQVTNGGGQTVVGPNGAPQVGVPVVGQPIGSAPAAAPPTTSFPGAPTTPAPAGSSVPGMIVPAPPPQPGAIGPTGAPAR